MSTILILGASRGIGLELTRQYLADGQRVIATARTDEALAQLRSLGAEARLLDVADPSSASGLAWQLDGEKIDTAFFVAGVHDSADARTPPTQETFDRVMRTNVLGAMQLIPQVAPLVQATGGRFAFVSSDMGRISGVRSSNAWVYRVSKAALNMTVATAQNAYPDIIMVCLHPGWVQTDMGGSDAPVTPSDSATGMRRVVAALTPEDRGSFIDYTGTRASGW